MCRKILLEISIWQANVFMECTDPASPPAYIPVTAIYSQACRVSLRVRRVALPELEEASLDAESSDADTQSTELWATIGLTRVSILSMDVLCY